MEQSKSISGVIAKLRIAYPYYFKDLDEELILGMVKIYQDQLVGYTPEIVSKAIDEIIGTSKFMPSIAEILEKCDNQSKIYSCSILKTMLDDGYFKQGTYGELDEIQESKNYRKAIVRISEGIIPEWLLEAMKKYGYKTNKLLPDKNEDEKEIGSDNDVRLLET